jgi:peptidoglycan/LPS O-acetylase OafA/YrhL
MSSEAVGNGARQGPEGPAVAVLPPVAPQSGERTHIPALDGLRGLAVLGVMLFHFLPYSHPSGQANPLVKYGLLAVHVGQTGVDLFFVLSGFLITGILLDTKGRPRYFSNFYMRRTLRIFPLYYGVLIFWLALPTLIRAGSWSAAADELRLQVWLWCYATNFAAMLHIPVPAEHFWSLAVEEHFYLVWPLVVYLTSRRGLRYVCLGLIVGALGCRAAFGLLGLSTFHPTPCRMDVLGCGGLLALAATRPGGLRAVAPLARWGLLACLAGTVPLYVATSGSHALAVGVFKHTLAAGLYSCLLVVVVCADRRGAVGRAFNGGFLRTFGKYSYGLYVFHALLLPLFDRWLPLGPMTERSGSFVLAALARAAGATAVSFAVAWLSWHLYEKQFLKLKRFFAYQKPSIARPDRTAPAAKERTAVTGTTL